MGTVRGLPVGLSFIGPRWDEARLLAVGAAFARAIPRVPPPAMPPAVAPPAERLLEPVAAAR